MSSDITDRSAPDRRQVQRLQPRSSSQRPKMANTHMEPLCMEPHDSKQHSQRPLRARSRLRPSPLPAPSSLDAAAAPIPDKRSRRALRAWFLRWQQAVQCHGEASRRLTADVYAQQRAVKEWSRFLHQRRRKREKIAMMDAWKLARACGHWTRWATRRRQLRTLLYNERQSLVGRLLLARVWARWARFAKQHRRIRVVTETRLQRTRQRLALRVWHALRAHAFRSQHERYTLRLYLQRMRRFQELQERSRVRCFQHQQLLARERKRRLLRRWRVLAYTADRERRLFFRVQFGICRKRYFSLWWQAGRIRQRTALLRAKIKRRDISQHFDAWERMTRVIQMGRQMQRMRDRSLRVVYFAALKEQTRLLCRARYAALALDFLRLSRAVREMHVWAVEQRRQRADIFQLRLQQEKRIVRLAWCHGWLPFHCRKHRGKLAMEHGRLALEARLLGLWKRFQLRKRVRDEERQRAEVLYCKFCSQRTLGRWKRYLQSRHAHERQLQQGEKHYRSRLMQKGVVFLWTIVNQKAQNVVRSQQLHRNARISLKKRQFFWWRELTLRRVAMARRLDKYRRSSVYQISICNPHRRIWLRWQNYVAWSRKCRVGAINYRARMERRVFTVWYAQAAMESRLRTFSQAYRIKTVVWLFDRWVRRAAHWRKVRAIHELSQQIYERKVCIRVLRGWSHCCSGYLPRLRLCGETLRRAHDMKMRFKWFWTWQARFHIHQRLMRLRDAREHCQLQLCFTGWRQYSAKYSALQRKFGFFQRVHGKYPCSSLTRRFWHQWTSFVSSSKKAKQLRRRCLRRVVGPYWAQWVRFRMCYRHFHHLRRAVAEMSSNNGKLGTRLRHFRESQRRVRQSNAIEQWKALVYRRKTLHERQLLLKHQMNHEFKAEFKKLEQTTRLRLQHWLRRWCSAQIQVSTRSRAQYAVCLLRKALVLWWKATIHAKQERVLSEAQHAIGNLSFYHAYQRQHAVVGQRNRKTRRSPVCERPASGGESFRREELRRMRRMLDPAGQPNYSALYDRHQDNDAHGVEHTYDTCCQHSHQVNDDAPSSAKNRSSDGLSSVATAKPRLRRAASQQVTGATVCMGDQERSFSHGVNDSERSKIPIHSEYRSEQSGANERHRLPPRHSKMVGNMLPLFDADIISQPDTHPRQCILRDDMVAKREPELAHHHDQRSQDPVRIAETPRCCQEVASVTSTEIVNAAQRGDRDVTGQRPIAFDSAKRLVQARTADDHRGQYCVQSKARSGAQKRKMVPKVLEAASDGDRALADILEIPDEQQVYSMQRQKVPSSGKELDEEKAVFDDSVIGEVMVFYMDALVNDKHYTDASDKTESLNGRRKRVCFRMVRDLALFQNDFYINEFEKVYTDSFRYATTGSSERLHPEDRLKEQDRLELFLGQIVQDHPSYLDYRARGHKGVKTLSSLPLDPLTWLARCHLQPLAPKSKGISGRSSNRKASWMGDPLPTDMERALEKLLPVIKKYMRVLGQFFMREAVQRKSKKGNLESQRISNAAFVSLMKQVQVFPQLFHRRELEEAVDMSCRSWSCRGAANLNFPEFVEALLRCSCSLRWGDVDSNTLVRGRQGEGTAVVIKFLMLVFAMEGNGSVLQKRSDDLNVILGFLSRQKQQNKSEKLNRFHHMLAEDKRKRQSKKAKQNRSASFWSHIRLRLTQPSLQSSMSHYTFEELTRSWGRNSHCDDESLVSESSMLDVQTNEPSGAELYSPTSSNTSMGTGSTREMHTASLPTSNDDTHADIDRVIRNGGVAVNVDEIASRTSPLAASSPPDQAKTAVDPVVHNSDMPPTAESLTQASELREASPVRSDASDLAGERAVVQPHIVEAVVSVDTVDRGANVSSVDAEREIAKSALPPGLVEPMDKEEFLQDILSSIGDVELLLHQTKPSGRSRPRSALSVDRPSTIDAHSPFSWEISPKLSDVPADFTLHDISSGSWEASSHIWSSGAGQSHADVPIQDPMLNYLTDIDRFTESTDNNSLTAIAEMSDYPFTPGTVASATDASDPPPSPEMLNTLL